MIGPLSRVKPIDLADPRLLAFLQAHLDDMAPTAPPESRHALDAAGLAGPGVRLFVVRDDARPVATGGLARVGPESDRHEELKSMRTDPAYRGRGLGTTIIAGLEADAAVRGIRRLSLETGSMDFFAPARRLYERHGFTPCPPFGAYHPDPNCVWMTKLVDAARTSV